MAAFLEAMSRDLAGRFVVVRDGGPMHKGDPIRDLTGHFADRLDLERLPPYAPMLNPAEPRQDLVEERQGSRVLARQMAPAEAGTPDFNRRSCKAASP